MMIVVDFDCGCHASMRGRGPDCGLGRLHSYSSLSCSCVLLRVWKRCAPRLRTSLVLSIRLGEDTSAARATIAKTMTMERA